MKVKKISVRKMVENELAVQSNSNTTKVKIMRGGHMIGIQNETWIGRRDFERLVTEPRPIPVLWNPS